MILRISVRSGADAQALFDLLHGAGLRLHEKGNGWAVLYVERADASTEPHIRKCYPAMRFKCRAVRALPAEGDA